jgi:hypothetical protein
VPFIAVLLLAIEMSQVLDKRIGHLFFLENFYRDSISFFMLDATVFFNKSVVSCKEINHKKILEENSLSL